MKASELRQIIREEVTRILKEESVLNEDYTLDDTNSLGLVGGYAGLYSLYKGIPFTAKALGDSAEAMVYRYRKQILRARQIAQRQGRLDAIKPILTKFENDSKLKDMYNNLPNYSSGISAKAARQNEIRTKQLKEIAKYIKSKLTPDEMKFFEDVSSMLRTGDIK
jgi:hypothetical protein